MRPALFVGPTVAGSEVSIRASVPSGMHPSLRVLDCAGRLVARIAVPKSNAPFSWRPLDREGKRLVAGTYLVVLQGSRDRLVRKLVLK
ncbi:hypothetical protein JXD38_03370 [candidate division WOR-3 bacterium]|nr:hypothetical protein [candidate division WOR-3 bacterium]